MGKMSAVRRGLVGKIKFGEGMNERNCGRFPVGSALLILTTRINATQGDGWSLPLRKAATRIAG
jgi:hypothetical protein